ncbi:WbqC family protein [Lacinutrix sp. C3R15]|uniref:WbqC family protein n=1 Tax=Flavobacteriaceae TaxID=49546 RepID=UPI001C0814B3|nr:MULTISPECIES: WbqC family protein [Flavobacteriaceae]MBU2940727.1 WbqC family protein [Lacinutrix sp. C3R15]MDO6624045.1 WbqC family protein [Oceanihabitans sp. 1_MG-2023]
MNLIIHPTYFPNIAHFAAMLQAKEVVLEMHDNYQKQTYRNRTFIYGANGKLQLSVPVVYSQKERQKYQDIKIHNNEKWQSLHWKSLESAYRTSPYFEFYEDELKPLFTQKVEYLLDFNLKCFETILECLQLDLSISETKDFQKETLDNKDFRYLVNSRKEPHFNFDTYTQVFGEKHGFISNLSILDLLFNEGTNALSYLENQFNHL